MFQLLRLQIFFKLGATAPPQWARASSFTRFLDHTQPRTTVGRIPLDEWPARHRHLPENTQHLIQTDIHASSGIRNHNLSRPQTYALDCAATGTGYDFRYWTKNKKFWTAKILSTFQFPIVVFKHKSLPRFIGIYQIPLYCVGHFK